MSHHFISRQDAESDLFACSAFLAERVKSSDGYAEAMKAIVPRYLAKGEVDLAAELANSIEDPFTRDKLLIEVAEKCAEMNDDEYALQLAEAIDDFGLKSQALEKIALQRAAKGDIEKALEIADGMAHPDYVFAGVAVYQSAAGKDADAAATLEAIDFAAARVFALQSIAMEKLAQKKGDEAVAFLEQAGNAASGIEHDEEKIRALVEVGNHFVEADRKDKAIGSYDTARDAAENLDNMHRDSFLAGVSLGFLHAGSEELADRTLDLVTDKTQIASCLVGFARDHWQKEEKTDALEALEEAYAILKSQRETETRDSRARFNLLGSIATQFAGFGKAERGIEIAQELPDENEKMSSLAQMAQILTIQKDDELARRIVNGLGEEVNRVFALVGMAEAKVRIGEKEMAIEFLDDAASIAVELPQLSSRATAMETIAARFIDIGEAARARDICEGLLRTISAIRDESNRAIALAGLSDIYRQTGAELGESEKELIGLLIRKSD